MSSHTLGKDIPDDVNFLIQEYAKHAQSRKGPRKIPCPLRFSASKRWCSSWDAKFIDAVALNLPLLYDLGAVAHKYNIEGLRDLVCAKIASIARDCYPYELKDRLSVKTGY